MDTQSMAREMLESLSQLVRGPIRDLRGLSGGEMGMLVYLEVKNGAAPTELGRFFGISSARVTNALNSLEKKGFVLRQPVPGDRRRVRVNITDAGTGQLHASEYHPADERSGRERREGVPAADQTGRAAL